MRTIRTIGELRAWLGNARAEGRTVGLVPTMGAFHAGHHSLMRTARAEQDAVVVSLFVNPAQFNDTGDLAAYPRTRPTTPPRRPSSASTCCSPRRSSEIYPEGFATTVSRRGALGGARGRRARPRALRRRLHRRQQAAEHRRARRRVLRPEGRAAGRGGQADGARPGHAGADRGLPTVREPDGLALSSRNVRLSRSDRARALALSRALHAAREAVAAGERDADRVRAAALEELTDVRAEYLAIVDPVSFTELTTIVAPALVAVAAHVGPVRLIDNLVVEPVPAPVAT